MSIEDETAVLYDCLLRFMALSDMYSDYASKEVEARIQRELLRSNNYDYEDDFLHSAIKFLNKRQHV